MTRLVVDVVTAVAAVAAGALAGCTDHRGGITGTQSIGITVVDPASPGDPDHRLDQRTITIDLVAYGPDHEVDAAFDHQVQLYVQFLGTLTPTPDFTGLEPASIDDAPQTIQMTAGRATGQIVTLPGQVLGPTTLWVDDARSSGPTFATGTSATLWFRDPTIVDIQRPVRETALDALESSPLENKQVTVAGSRHGAAGRLVVTSVFSQGYTVSDVECTDAAGAPPCTAGPYDHIEVFSFSAPRDQRGNLIRQGQLIDGFSGGISEFNGLTEVGFPVTRASGGDVDPARLPEPVVLDPATWFGPLSSSDGIIQFERYEAAPIEVRDAAVCDLDADYDEFGQWKLDPAGAGGDCSQRPNLINVITTGVIPGLDRGAITQLAGRKLTRVVGVLRPIAIGSFHVWIMYPRSPADVAPPGPA